MKYLNSLDECRAIKVPGTASRSGEPDIDGCIRGRTIKLEAKRPNGKYGATKLQETILGEWQKAGAITGVVRTVDDVKNLLKKEGIL